MRDPGVTEASGTGLREKTVCYVTQWFPPENVMVPFSIARSLRDRGWTVSVLTGMPNYPQGVLHAGYGGMRAREGEVDGMRTRRTPLFPYHGRSAIKRMANYLSWALSATFLGRRAFENSDVSLVYSSPATAALPAMVARRLSGIPFVLLIQDLWPDSVFASGFLAKGLVTRTANALISTFVTWTYSRASHIVVISPGMVDVLESRGVPREKISLVYNWVDESVYSPRPRSSALRDRIGLDSEDYIVLYAGNHGAAQGLSHLIEAIALIPEHRRCHAVLVGDGVEKRALENLAATVAPGRVHFLGPRPSADIPHLMASADIQFISLADEPLFHHTMPSKVQSTLASGVPSIVAVPGDAARVVGHAGAGFVATPGDSRSIAEAIMRSQDAGPVERQTMGSAARRLYEEEMSAAVGSSSLSQILEGAVRARHHNDLTPAGKK